MGITVFYLFSVFTSFVMGSSMESVKENVIKSTIFIMILKKLNFLMP